MVPIKDMVDALRVTKDVPHLRVGSYVRLKRTVYKGDLAQVDWVDIAHNKVNLKLVPRIDYNKMRGTLRSENDKNAKKTRKPLPRLFDLERIKEIGGEVTTDGDFIVFEGNHYRAGLLYRSFYINAIIVDGVKPSFTELEKFQESADGLQKELENTMIREKGHSFAPGDVIEVVEGELQNLKGKVESVEGEKVTIAPDLEGFQETIAVNAGELHKFFKAGDHVKVLAGEHVGNTGLIVRVESNVVIILSDLSLSEMKVRPRDVRLCAETMTGIDSMGRFRFHDLVQIDPQTVGVIVRIEKEALEILDQFENVQRIKPQAIMGKKDCKYAVALDKNGNGLYVNDYVKVIDGPHAAKKDDNEPPQVEIRHIFKSFVFVYSRMHTDNGGIFVCRPKHLLLAGGTNRSNMPAIWRPGSTPNPTESPRLPAFAPFANYNPENMSPASFVAGFSLNDNNRPRRDNTLIGKTVRITMGPLKGYVGIVKDATDSTVRVELHAECKTIPVDRSRIKVIGEELSGLSNASNFSRTPAFDGSSRTPMYHTGRTPTYQGASTPYYGGSTPGRTLQHGSSTPWYEREIEGKSTSSYIKGAGERSPSHNAPNKFSATPAYDPSADRFASSPSYDPGNSTPAYEITYESPAANEDQRRGPHTPSYNPSPYQSSEGGSSPLLKYTPSVVKLEPEHESTL
ncbi:hypothetical protein WR25_20374 [Diploscapter pachys]|uniref:Transcription elongation factor SPT5 n=1 Tax=Diploscapter pachys TaxID=2018661 RepID=A0A2A2KUS0_9BILA|nr:hypothetical protein WR25_20374 [Diploscapter pachys]